MFLYQAVDLGGTDLAELSAGQGLREDSGINETEGVPLGRCFRFEVPEDPADGVFLERLHLSLNVTTHIVLEGLGPLIHVVYGSARADIATARVCTVVTSTNTVTIQGGGAITHSTRPLFVVRRCIKGGG
jgi:hypothetical protein